MSTRTTVFHRNFRHILSLDPLFWQNLDSRNTLLFCSKACIFHRIFWVVAISCQKIIVPFMPECCKLRLKSTASFPRLFKIFQISSYIVHCYAIISKRCSQALWSIFSLTALFSHQHLVSIAIVKFGLNELHHCREHGLFKAHTLLRWQSFTIFMKQKLIRLICLPLVFLLINTQA